MKADTAAVHPDSTFDDDSHLPRSLRRFPYRALDAAEAAEVRVEVDAILRGVEDMIHRAVLRRMLPREQRRADLKDDIAQEVSIYLATHSLPRFDSTRRVKVTTFLHQCIVFRTIELLSADRSRRRRTIPSGLIAEACPAPDVAMDRAVESLADRIVEDPDAFGLSTAEARCVRAAIEAGPLVQRQELARALGYVHQGSFSTQLQRARKHIAELDLVV